MGGGRRVCHWAAVGPSLAEIYFLYLLVILRSCSSSLVKLLLRSGWTPHKKCGQSYARGGATRRFPADWLTMTINNLRCIGLLPVIFNKKGALGMIVFNCVNLYYKYLIESPDLTRVAGLTAAELQKMREKDFRAYIAGAGAGGGGCRLRSRAAASRGGG